MVILEFNPDVRNSAIRWEGESLKMLLFNNITAWIKLDIRIPENNFWSAFPLERNKESHADLLTRSIFTLMAFEVLFKTAWYLNFSNKILNCLQLKTKIELINFTDLKKYEVRLKFIALLHINIVRFKIDAYMGLLWLLNVNIKKT